MLSRRIVLPTLCTVGLLILGACGRVAPTSTASSSSSVAPPDPDAAEIASFGQVYMPQLQAFVNDGEAWAKTVGSSATKIAATSKYADQVDAILAALTASQLPPSLRGARDQLDDILRTFSGNLRTMVRNHQVFTDPQISAIMVPQVNRVGQAFQVFGDALAFQAELHGAQLPPFPTPQP